MCGGFTGEHEMKVHKKAEIVEDNGFVVHLFKNYEQFGTVDVRDKSIHYANDVCEIANCAFNEGLSWETFLLDTVSTNPYQYIGATGGGVIQSNKIEGSFVLIKII